MEQDQRTRKLMMVVLEGIRVQKYVLELALTGTRGGRSQEENYFVDFRHKSAPQKHALQEE